MGFCLLYGWITVTVTFTVSPGYFPIFPEYLSGSQ